MGLSKKEYFSDEDQELSAFFKALGSPARLAIIKFLLNYESCFTGKIVDEIPLSQSTVSQHLKELKKAGILQGTTLGKNTKYCINKQKWDEFAKDAKSLLNIKVSDADC